MPDALVENPPSPDSSGRWLGWLLVGMTAAAFGPVTRWVVAEAVAREQIKQGGVLLLAAAALIVWQHRRDLHLNFDLGNRALGLLGAAFACVGAAGALGWPLLVLPGLTLGLAGSLQVLFGATGYRFLKPLVAGVAALVVIIMLFPFLDWPLRQLAGVEAARMLQALGLAPQLNVTGTPSAPQLLLTVGQHVFVVATECNGFGLITSGALLALLAGGISERPRWTIAGLVALALATGFAMNVARILTITQLAPKFPGHYHAMHEVVGTAALWAGLGLVGWLAWKPQPSVLPPAISPAKA